MLVVLPVDYWSLKPTPTTSKNHPTMPALTLNQAAKEAKKSKAAIIEALKTGRLSGVKNDLGQWQIQPVELFRVYPQNQSVTGIENRNRLPAENQPTTDETAILRQQITLIGQEREREREQLQSTINDLRQRLDTESQERRQLTALLTHQNQEKPAENRPTSSRMVWLVVLLVLVSVSAVLALRFDFI